MLRLYKRIYHKKYGLLEGKKAAENPPIFEKSKVCQKPLNL
jgi:hypothetical protein